MPSYLPKSTRPSMVKTLASTLMSTLPLSTPGISRTMVKAGSASKMSAVGTNDRAGIVDSCFFSISRFCWTCSSWGDMIKPPQTCSIDGNGARLVAFRSRNQQRQHAVAILGLDGVGIDLHGNGERAVETSG